MKYAWIEQHRDPAAVARRDVIPYQLVLVGRRCFSFRKAPKLDSFERLGA